MATIIVLDPAPTTIVVADPGKSPVVVAGGGSTFVTSDGKGPAGRSATAGFGCFLPGVITGVNQVLLRWPSIGDTPLSASLSVAIAGTVAQADTVLVIKVNGVVQGSITFLAGQAEGTISLSVAMLTNGQVLEIIGPAVPDGTLGDITVNFVSPA